MGAWAHAATLLRAMREVTRRRRRQGPLRPGWSWRYEVVVAFLKATNGRVIREEAVVQRAEMEGIAPRLTPALLRVKRQAVDAGGVPAVWFVPRGGASDAVVLYLHGGSYIFGSTRTHGDLIARIGLAAKARVLGLEYRLAPEHPFPAALEDAVAAYRWLLASGVAPGRIVLAGDSAGGGLAVAAMLKLREQGAPLPAGGLLLAPWVDLECSGESMVRHEPYDWGDRAMLLHWAKWYVGGASPREPLVSPTHASLSGLPPLFIQTAGVELVRDDVTRFAEKARAAGVQVELEVWPEMVHNFQTFGVGFPESERAVARLGEAARALTSGQALLPAATLPA